MVAFDSLVSFDEFDDSRSKSAKFKIINKYFEKLYQLYWNPTGYPEGWKYFELQL